MYNMRWQDYLEMVKEPAKRVCETYGLPYACCVAQGALESQWGLYGLGNGGYNIFGRKAVEGDSYVTVRTGEDDGTGQLYYINANFKSYGSMEEAVVDWCELMLWGAYAHYAQEYKESGDLEGFVVGISSIYATDIYYAGKIMAIINDGDCELL